MSAPLVRWRVNKWSKTPERHEFVRETEHFLIYMHHGKERKDKKVTDWDTYFDTEEDALAQIAKNRAHCDKVEADRLVRNAAPDLLLALQAVMGWHDYLGNKDDPCHTQAREALAKATQA